MSQIPFDPERGRDYSLTGEQARLAEEAGLVSAVWYQCPVPRKRMKELMQRSDGRAIRDTALWLGARSRCRGAVPGGDAATGARGDAATEPWRSATVSRGDPATDPWRRRD